MSNESLKRLILIFSICLISITLTSCADIYQAVNRPKPAPPPSPGLYRLNGWNGSTSGIDIEGEIGHPLTVNGPTADCEPSRDWSGDQRINSGKLPPGLTMDDKSGGITGIPTVRNHFVVEVELYNVQCGGNSYRGFTQELRFHITGTGKVVN